MRKGKHRFPDESREIRQVESWFSAPWPTATFEAILPFRRLSHAQLARLQQAFDGHCPQPKNVVLPDGIAGYAFP